MKFFKQVQLGDFKFTVEPNGREPFQELTALVRRIDQMNRVCGSDCTPSFRTTSNGDEYFEMVKMVPKIPVDNSDFKTTLIKMRISKGDDKEIPGWPWFIYKTQRWEYHDPKKNVSYFLNDEDQWVVGDYDSKTGIWTEV